MNSNTLSDACWTCDDYGTSGLHTPQGGHVWLQGRRPYCDRGHWEWGSTGFPHNPDITPSYYFMDLERGRSEVERWLTLALGGQIEACSLPDIEGQFSRNEGRAAGWQWHRDGQSLVAEANDARLVLRLSDNKQSVVVTARGIDGLDDSDRFPRIFLDGAVAVAEVEDFLVWRLLQQPTQIPGHLNHAPKPVAPGLGKLLKSSGQRRSPRP